MQESIVFLVGVQCRRKESSLSLSHLLMSFLLSLEWEYDHDSVLINITVDSIINVSCNPCNVGPENILTTRQP